MLRHTHATLRVKNSDGNMKEIKKLSMDLGHESVAITMDLYVHPDMQDRREAINKFNLGIEA
jgi:integrase